MAPPTLGLALKKARGAESLRSLGRRTGVSKSALDRYERGLATPKSDILQTLDLALDQHGGLVALAGVPAQLGSLEPVTLSRHTFPAGYLGPVWALVARPATATPVDLLFRWGPWGRRVQLNLTAEGILLHFEISRTRPNPDSPPVTLRSARPVRVAWGLGLPAHGRSIDLSDGWFPYEEGDLLRTAGDLLSDALAFCGRTPAELATFLGVDQTAVDGFLRGEPMTSPEPTST